MTPIIITGASDGIGAASARQLKSKGRDVVVVGRSKDKTEALARELRVPFHIADYAKLSDVQRLAAELSRYDGIAVLANNAGGIMGERQITEDGFEKTFQVNHLAPFLLTKLLMEKLIASQAKIIQTASVAANFLGSSFDLDDLNNERKYKPDLAYGNGKLANILFTRELHRRYHDQGINSVAFHPGVVRTSFATDTTHLMRFIYHTPLKYLVTISPDSGGQRLTALVDGTPGVDWISGQVYNKKNLMAVNLRDGDGRIAQQLWDASEAMVARFCG